jgi:hypothetical protein
MQLTRSDYKLSTFRNAGLKAKWTHTRLGAPIIAATLEGFNKNWFWVDGNMWKRMEKSGDVLGTWKDYTALGDIFSVRS